MSIREIAEEIDSRFNSLNDVPVRDVRLTREEWAAIKLALVLTAIAKAEGGGA